MEPGAHEPRVESLHALMRDIGALRRRLETDLTLTAAALEHGELAVVDDLLDDGLAHVHAFEAQAAEHLGEPVDWPAPVAFLPPRERRLAVPGLRGLAAAASVAAFAVVALASPASQGGVVLQASAPPPDQVVRVDGPVISTASLGLARTYDALSLLALAPERPGEVEIRQVADRLAEQVTGLSSSPAPDPEEGLAALRALTAEKAVLQANDEAGSLGDLIARNALLTESLLDTLTSLVPPLGPVVRPGTPAPTAPALQDLIDDLDDLGVAGP